MNFLPYYNDILFKSQPARALTMAKQTRRPQKSRATIIQNGYTKIVRTCFSRFHWGDLYHSLFTLPFPQLLALMVLGYIAVNILFAFAYLLGGDGIANAQPGSFKDVFFFSVQTLVTIGYGAMYPQTAYTNTLVVIESFIGLLGVAMATGLMFARFSKPTARVLFSNNAVICPYNNVPTLMFRAANQRSNLIVEAEVNVRILLPEITPEGHSLRRVYDLNLVRSSTPLFLLSWMVMHPIDEKSPLFGQTAESLANSNSQIIVTFQGLDESVIELMHARQTYDAKDILWNMRFVDVVTVKENGDRAIDYTHFHDVAPFENF
ncbi:MAG: ion channel [Cyanobacteriota bacterium]|nr:ion channel [Cyanobacteriota bacterium]